MTEIKGAVMEMKQNSALGPNGLLYHSSKIVGKLSKNDLGKMFLDLWQLDVKRLNFGVITLVPKISEANTIKQYRHCLLNVDFKIVTKVLTN